MPHKARYPNPYAHPGRYPAHFHANSPVAGYTPGFTDGAGSPHTAGGRGVGQMEGTEQGGAAGLERQPASASATDGSQGEPHQDGRQASEPEDDGTWSGWVYDAGGTSPTGMPHAGPAPFLHAGVPMGWPWPGPVAAASAGVPWFAMPPPGMMPMPPPGFVPPHAMPNPGAPAPVPDVAYPNPMLPHAPPGMGMPYHGPHAGPGPAGGCFVGSPMMMMPVPGTAYDDMMAGVGAMSLGEQQGESEPEAEAPPREDTAAEGPDPSPSQSHDERARNAEADGADARQAQPASGEERGDTSR
mmetsp:Transcript_12820/g.25020  ORF Transcript_12820/g.25020 Transcript_12820/m.25020 type:complete len:299 (-) Transcript_12820:285-1181(-)